LFFKRIRCFCNKTETSYSLLKNCINPDFFFLKAGKYLQVLKQKCIFEVMIRRAFILLFITSCVSAVALQLDISYFTAKSDGKSAVVVEWKSTSEQGVMQYDIERAGGQDQEFKFIASLSPKGANSTYQYVDADAFMRTNANGEEQKVIAGTTYKYRLKILSKGAEPAYSSTAIVSHSVSSVRRTWGMIKEMFR
jgi:hypothetical protein